MDYNEDQTGANNETSLEDMFNDSTTLLIGAVFDLETEENSESFANMKNKVHSIVYTLNLVITI
ncbi:20646_t:CDS:2 [Gigaspora rosea]|nr:20646_t:CDS:2 [Gigaspora rosea]